ncbi:DUF2889 domain-containing protein [Azospirillum halopraeferens]|uniref:DUF2889 domain-containing protein n=1 Tax=Azospirillum halopraeferens TaxID=34010 RepID=UPI00041F6B90|nr:DUF2889 domain-containing protein [Azospirillum halopraeferens]
MPLTESSPREPIHTRTIVLNGFRRADGLWDIEGHLTDVKAYTFRTEERGQLEPGDPVHDMWLRLTVDDNLTVQAIEAVTDKSPYGACGAITDAFQCLVGLSVAKGWTRAVRERLGGVHGCTHLVELLGPIGTTAFQTIYPILARERARKAREGQGGQDTARQRPVLLNTCHIFASDGDVVRRHWPDHYTGDRTVDAEAGAAD